MNRKYYTFTVKKIEVTISECCKRISFLHSCEDYKQSREYQILTEIAIDNSRLRNKFLKI